MFDPNGIGVENGNLFGFPVSLEESELVVIGMPFDLTASYGIGSSKGPQAIVDASIQLDFYHEKVDKAWTKKVFYYEPPSKYFSQAGLLRKEVSKYLKDYEQTGKISERNQRIINEVNSFQSELKSWLEKECFNHFKNSRLVAVLGGEHSVPLGLLSTLDLEGSFGVLQIDAHADLRTAYEGFDQSHASIMFNTLKLSNVEKLVTVGLRDYAPIEAELMESNPKVKSFTWSKISDRLLEGASWKKLVTEIIDELPEKVYISFDIDGLDPSLCPNTGTPVPGGLSFDQARYLLWALKESGRQVVGFDLCEVAPGEDDWDANVGARVLWELCQIS